MKGGIVTSDDELVNTTVYFQYTNSSDYNFYISEMYLETEGGYLYTYLTDEEMNEFLDTIYFESNFSWSWNRRV